MTDADELTTLAGQGIVSIGEAADGLAAQLKALQEAGLMDREAYREAIVRLVNTWSQTSDFMGARAQAAEAGMVLRYLPPGASNNDIDAIYPGAAMLATGGGNAEAVAVVLTTVDLEQQARVAEFRETIARIEYLVSVLEPMNGVPFVDVTVKGDEPAIVTGAGTRIFAVATTPP
ncbi:MAG: hypothetical protein LBF93_06065, partial [Zoogloeaceae bacterium]|nr:hypothetical protein [Zoogloeaceae bacterium]